MNTRMEEREQRELEREQLQTDQDRGEREIRMRRNKENVEIERRKIEVKKLLNRFNANYTLEGRSHGLRIERFT